MVFCDYNLYKKNFVFFVLNFMFLNVLYIRISNVSVLYVNKRELYYNM